MEVNVIDFPDQKNGKSFSSFQQEHPSSWESDVVKRRELWFDVVGDGGRRIFLCRSNFP
tara:strand:+ start:217 stop:393 length:177 start_codon:yes stop_codon:yes gene_type:complete